MITLKNVTATLALGLALVAATPVLAAQRSHHPGHAARAEAPPIEQVIPGGAEGVSGLRAKAIEDCSGLSGKFSQSTWGNWQTQTYRSCMAGHGQAE